MGGTTGQSRVWGMDQKSGPYPEGIYKDIKHRCLGDFVMSQPFETLFMLDSKVKHEARAIKPILKDLPCRRDVIVHWIRTPKLNGCDKVGEDCEAFGWGSAKLQLAGIWRRDLNYDWAHAPH